jgi:hypothetical protein
MADLSASATGRFGGLEQQHVDHPAADERLARSMPGLGGGGARAGAGRREKKKKKKKKKATGAAAKSNAQKPVWAREGRHSRFSVQGGIHHPSSIPGATVDAHNHVALWQYFVAGAPVLLTHNVQPTRGIVNGAAQAQPRHVRVRLMGQGRSCQLPAPRMRAYALYVRVQQAVRTD